MLLHRRVTAVFRVALPTTMESLTITVIDAARALRISRTKAYAMARSGELPTFRIGRAVRVPIAELRAWIASQARLQQNLGTPLIGFVATEGAYEPPQRRS